MSVTTAFTNHSEQTVYIGGRSVQPNETREVDARFVPAVAEINRQILVLFINFDSEPRYFGTTVVQHNEAARLPIIHFENPNELDAGAFQDQVFESLLEKSIDHIRPYFSTLEEEELQRLMELENGKSKRKNLLKELADEVEKRKQAREFDPQVYAASIQGKDENELQVELLAAADHTEKLAIIQQALSELKQAKQA